MFGAESEQQEGGQRELSAHLIVPAHATKAFAVRLRRTLSRFAEGWILPQFTSRACSLRSSHLRRFRPTLSGVLIDEHKIPSQMSSVARRRFNHLRVLQHNSL